MWMLMYLCDIVCVHLNGCSGKCVPLVCIMLEKKWKAEVFCKQKQFFLSSALVVSLAGFLRQSFWPQASNWETEKMWEKTAADIEEIPALMLFNREFRGNIAVFGQTSTEANLSPWGNAWLRAREASLTGSKEQFLYAKVRVFSFKLSWNFGRPSGMNLLSIAIEPYKFVFSIWNLFQLAALSSFLWFEVNLWFVIIGEKYCVSWFYCGTLLLYNIKHFMRS